MRTMVLLGVVITCSFSSRSSRQACRVHPHAVDAPAELHKSTDCRPGKAQIRGPEWRLPGPLRDRAGPPFRSALRSSRSSRYRARSHRLVARRTRAYRGRCGCSLGVHSLPACGHAGPASVLLTGGDDLNGGRIIPELVRLRPRTLSYVMIWAGRASAETRF